MIAYDANQPLIIIHIPKAAGHTAMVFFKQWFKDGFLQHYYDGQKEEMPPKHDIFGLHSAAQPICLHGHFNRIRKFGVEDYYPNAKQFITIVRDPYELVLSNYHYVKHRGVAWNNPTYVPSGELRDFLQKAKPNMLNHFPRKMNLDNYKDIIEEYFIEIGITEHLDSSMRRISEKLCMPYDPSLLGRLNVTKRDTPPPNDLKDMFIENNPLEYAVYEY